MSTRVQPPRPTVKALRGRLARAARRLDRAKDKPLDHPVRARAYLAYLQALRACEQAALAGEDLTV